MISKRFIVTFLIAAAIGSKKAAAWDVSALGGISFALPSLTALNTGIPTSTSATLGIGAGIGYELDTNLALEIDALYLPRKYQPEGKPMYTETRLHLPIFLRYIAYNPVHILAGLYYSQGLGSIDGDDGSSVNYQVANQTRSDWGFIAGVGALLPLTGNAKLLIRGQYLLGIGNASTNPLVILNYRDIQGIVGVNWAI